MALSVLSILDRQVTEEIRISFCVSTCQPPPFPPPIFPRCKLPNVVSQPTKYSSSPVVSLQLPKKEIFIVYVNEQDENKIVSLISRGRR